ncbi:MAG: hypothetical protein HY903_07145 [Deltaproteobacteria bacterium]|nr:hypothetical protein [Deltaproteobacteria bacterium]
MLFLNAARLALLIAVTGSVAASCGSDSKIASLPVANAGFDHHGTRGVELRLDGSASFDPTGVVLSYAWVLVTAPAGSNATLIAATTAQPTITPDLGGDYLISLVVNNGERDSLPDVTAIIVSSAAQNQTPTAVATCLPGCKIDHGTSHYPNTATQVTLDGRQSLDPDDSTASLTYQWTQIVSSTDCGECPALASCNPINAAATFLDASDVTTLAKIQAPMAVGFMVFRLTVTDPHGLSGVACVNVEATNNAPLAIVQTPGSLTVNEGEVITLNGSTSSDPDLIDQPGLTYLWTAAPTVATFSPNSTTKSVTAIVTGLAVSTDVTFTLTAFDAFGASTPCGAGSGFCGRTCCGEVLVHVLH